MCDEVICVSYQGYAGILWSAWIFISVNQGGTASYILVLDKLYLSRAGFFVPVIRQETEGYINKLRQQLPNAEIWQAFVIRDEQDLIKAKNSSADRVLLDNGYGTGKCFDWSLIKDFNREFILAGGITPENITDAAEKFSPYAIDVSSGVETEKIKDKEKIKAVITAIKGFRSEKKCLTEDLACMAVSTYPKRL